MLQEKEDCTSYSLHAVKLFEKLSQKKFGISLNLLTLQKKSDSKAVLESFIKALGGEVLASIRSIFCTVPKHPFISEQEIETRPNPQGQVERRFTSDA